MDRRNFLKSLALAGAALTVKQSGAMTLLTQHFNAAPLPAAGAYDLVAVMGGTPVNMFRKGIAEMGGMSKFGKKRI